MKATRMAVWGLGMGVLMLGGEVLAQTPMGTAFTYQGQLQKSGQPVNDTCDFQFTLWDDPNSADPNDQVGPTLTFDGVGGNPEPIDVVDGLFTVTLDFGGDVFTGDARWLEIAVRGSGDPNYATLSPRQELTPTPYAVFAEEANGFSLPFEGSAETAIDPLFKIKNTGNGNVAMFEGDGTGGVLFAGTEGDAQPAHFAIFNANNAHAVLAALTIGLGEAGIFMIENAANADPALESYTTGLGRAGYFHIDNVDNPEAALKAYTNGDGPAGHFQIDKVLNNSPALRAEISNGTGDAVHGYTTGVGRAGHFEINRSNNASKALEVYTNGIGGAGYFRINNPSNGQVALNVLSNGTGRVGQFWNTNGSNSNTALYAQTDGTGSAGWFTINNSANSSQALVAQTNGPGWAGYFFGADKGVWINVSASEVGLQCDGRIGIGVTSPTERLDVFGTARLRAMPSGSGTTVVADANGVLKRQSSSRRYKRDIRPLTVEPERVLQLEPVGFTWKETGEEDIGLIAEEVERAIPDLVIYNRAAVPDGVKYDRLGVYLLEVVKSQQERITVLEQQIAELMAAASRADDASHGLGTPEEVQP